MFQSPIVADISFCFRVLEGDYFHVGLWIVCLIPLVLKFLIGHIAVQGDIVYALLSMIPEVQAYGRPYRAFPLSKLF